MFIGLFQDASSVSIPSTSDLAVTSGYDSVGEGPAHYVYDPAVGSAYVAANQRVSFVSANGRGFRLDPQQRLTIQMFGGRADGSYNNLGVGGTAGATDNGLALAAALTFLQANEISIGSNLYYRGGPRIHFPGAEGIYDFQSTVDIRSTVQIAGDSFGSGPSTILRFPVDVHGFRVQSYDTDAGGTVSPAAWSGHGTVFEGLHLMTQGASQGEGVGDAHGIWARTVVTVSRCSIVGFSGNGVHIVASAGSGGLTEGNANGFRLSSVLAHANESGIFIDGADANAGLIEHCSANNNRGYGIWDSSFLGNTIIGCHTMSNGVLTANSASTAMVSHGGNRYSVLPGQAAAASTTTPGTNDGVWHLIGAGGSSTEIPAWASGMPLRDGGAYRSDSTGARNAFIGCYSEGAQPPSYLISPAFVLGGLHGAGIIGNVPDLNAWVSGFGNGRGNLLSMVDDSTGRQMSSLGGDPGTLLSFTHDVKFPLGFKFGVSKHDYYEKEILFRYGNSNMIDPVFQVTGPNTTKEFGTGAPVPYLFAVPKMAFGVDGRIQTSGSAAPTSGAHAQGEIVWNIAPAAGGKVGWVCTAAGSPGTWKPFGAIDA